MNAEQNTKKEKWERKEDKERTQETQLDNQLSLI